MRRRICGSCRTRRSTPGATSALGADGFGLADDPGPDGRRWTYANIALCRAALVAEVVPGTKAALGPLLFARMRERRITAEVYRGPWENVGTPEQLEALDLTAPRAR